MMHQLSQILLNCKVFLYFLLIGYQMQLLRIPEADLEQNLIVIQSIDLYWHRLIVIVTRVCRCFKQKRSLMRKELLSYLVAFTLVKYV